MIDYSKKQGKMLLLTALYFNPNGLKTYSLQAQIQTLLKEI